MCYDWKLIKLRHGILNLFASPCAAQMRAPNSLLRSLSVLLILLLGVSNAGAQSPAPIARVITSGSKPYVEVKNGPGYFPYLIYGVHLRLDELPGGDGDSSAGWVGSGGGKDGADYYFNRAQYLGFNTVVVPVFWNKVESMNATGLKVYDFAYIQHIIDSATKYGLYVQFTWNGSDSCGYKSAPGYVNDSPTEYPLNKLHPDFLDLSNPKLISAESGALVALMNFVASHDPTNRVIMVEIESEPDGCGPIGSSMKWGNLLNMSDHMFAGGQFDAVNHLINALSSAVKKSSWSGITRVNIGTSYRAVDCTNYRADHNNGVDIFGIDRYSSSLQDNYNTLGLLDPPSLYAQLSPEPAKDPLASVTPGARSKYLSNVSYQPEGGGQYADLISLVLQNFAEGGGSLIYELRTTQSYQSNGVWQPNYDLGIYRRTTTANGGAANWTERDGTLTSVPYDISGGTPGVENNTESIRAFNQTIYKADQKIAAVSPDRCAAFNLGCALGTSGLTQTLNVGTVPVTFQAWSNSPAFAMLDTNGDLILMNFTDGNNFVIDPSFHHGASASAGYYDAEGVWHEQYKAPFNGNTLLAWKQEVIRVERAP